MPGREQRQTMMFSATFPRTVMRIADNFLNNPAMLKVGPLAINPSPSPAMLKVRRGDPWPLTLALAPPCSR